MKIFYHYFRIDDKNVKRIEALATRTDLCRFILNEKYFDQEYLTRALNFLNKILQKKSTSTTDYIAIHLLPPLKKYMKLGSELLLT